MKTLLLYLSYLITATASPVAIPAAATQGTPIGIFKDGDVISVRYTSGQWSRRIQNPPESPDSTLWNEIRVVIYREDLFGNRVVVGQPRGTYTRPYVFVATEGRHFIRMAEPRESGVGVVFYDIERKLVVNK